jgi:hypothetical protein
MDDKIDALQKKAGKVQDAYKKLIGPIISIIVPAALIGVVLYLALGGAFDIGDLANENGVVRLPVALLAVAIPVAYFIDAVGATAGVSIICAVLAIWLAFGIVTLIKAIKNLKSVEK